MQGCLEGCLSCCVKVVEWQQAETFPKGILGRNERERRVVSSDICPGFHDTLEPREGRARRAPHYKALPAAGRRFRVTPRHARTADGVRFSVENVSPASREDAHKPVLASDELRRRRVSEASAFYKSGKPTRLEVASSTPAGLVYVGSDSFLAACLMAFARHLPLALLPDHVWALISHGFARHVDQNAEALRSKFVQHEGKKGLVVRVDHFSMSNGVEGTGTPASLWERDVFPDFSKQIRANIGEAVYAATAGTFSTTDQVSQAVHDIVLMSALKNYFGYSMMTYCGIPQISLRGTREDWAGLRARAEHLGSLMLPEFAERWLGLLLPVLDEFVAAYDGRVNHGFWQSMVKLRNTGNSSGDYEFISGWLQLFYPYLSSGNENLNMRPWQQMYFAGPKLGQFPPISSAAPVEWEYMGATHHLHVHAGFAGITQDPGNGELTPALGWYATHDPQ